MPQSVNVPGVGMLQFPDGMSQADMAAAIQKNFPQIHPPQQPPGPSIGGALDAASTGVVNAAAGMGNAAIDLGSRALGFGPNKPIPLQSQTPAAQATLDAAGRFAQSLEGTPNTDTQIRQQIIDQRNKQLDGTLAGDIRDQIAPVAGDVAQLAPAATVAAKVANGLASAAEIKAMRPTWARAGFTSENAAAGNQLGLRNGLDNPMAGEMAGTKNLEILVNNNADVGNAVARRAAGLADEVAPGVATPLTKEALDKALEPMEAVYQRAAAGLGPQGDQVLQKLRQLRHDGFAGLNSDDPDSIAKGRAMLDEAAGLERVIEKNISPTSGTSIEQLRDARQAIAQNRTIYDSLRGEDVDLMKLGRFYRNGPTNYFADGPLKTLARWTDDNGAVVGARIKGRSTTLRQGMEGASGALDITKPGSWPQVARMTGIPQKVVRGPGVQQALRTMAPNDPNRFAPLPMRTPINPLVRSGEEMNGPGGSAPAPQPQPFSGQQPGEGQLPPGMADFARQLYGNQ